MSSQSPSKGYRYTQSASAPAGQAALHDLPKLSNHNPQSYAQNSRIEMGETTHPSTPPRTPRKASPNTTHILQGSAVVETSSIKQKSRNKNRPKNVNVSPATNRTARRTPPLASAGLPSSARPVATPTTAAYAGPTFHASPAPSTLPIPSFYSKSVPDSPGLRGMRQARDTSSTNTREGFTATPAGSRNSELNREESPLDLFFKADREEKARARSASSSQSAATATGPFQPPMSPRNSQTPPTGNLARQRYGHGSRSSSSGVFPFELDGPTTPNAPYGPAFSTPYSERINAARGSRNSTQALEKHSQSGESLERSEQLKAYLFSGVTPQSAPPPNTQAYPGGSRSHSNLPNESKISAQNSRTNGRTSGLRQEVTPTKTPTATPDRRKTTNQQQPPYFPYGQNSLYGHHSTEQFSASPVPVAPSIAKPSGDGTADIKGMEDSLRKILKMDSGINGSNVGKTAATSVSNYVGGRPQPMNNGVMGS